MRWLFAITVLLLAGSAYAAAADERRARDYYLLGEQEFNRGQYAAALEQFEKADRVAPKAEIHYNVALCLEKLGRYEEAMSRLRRYLAEKPKADDRSAVEAQIRRLEDMVAQQRAVMPPAPPPPRPWAYRHRASLITGGISAATLLAIIGTGIAAQQTFNHAGCDAQKFCTNAGSLRTAQNLAIASDVLLGVGLAGMATAVVLYIVEVKKPSAFAHVALTPNGMGFSF